MVIANSRKQIVVVILYLCVFSLFFLLGSSELFAQSKHNSSEKNNGEKVTNIGDGLLLDIVPILASAYSVDSAPLFSITDNSYLVLRSSRGDTISFLADKDDSGSPTSIKSFIANVVNFPTYDSNSTMTVELNHRQLPTKIDFGEYGQILLEYAEVQAINPGASIKESILKKISVNIVDVEPFTTEGALKKLIPCSGLMDCSFTVPPQVPTEKTGTITLESNTSFEGSNTKIHCYAGPGVNYDATWTPPSPSLSNGLYKSVLNYTAPIPPLLSRSDYVSLCTGHHTCMLRSISCAAEMYDMLTGGVIIHQLKNKIATLPVNSAAIDSLELIINLIRKGNPVSFAVKAAEVIANMSIDRFEADCEEKYDNVYVNLKTQFHATAYGDFVGSVSSEPKFVRLESSLPDLTISQLNCSGSQITGYDDGITKYIDVGSDTGAFPFIYETYSIKDRIKVLHGTELIYDTGCVGTEGSRSVLLNITGDQSPSTRITIKVFPNCQDTSGTAWYFIVGCIGEGFVASETRMVDFEGCSDGTRSSADIELCIHDKQKQSRSGMNPTFHLQ